jgi:hypothetical protein
VVVEARLARACSTTDIDLGCAFFLANEVDVRERSLPVACEEGVIHLERRTPHDVLARGLGLEPAALLNKAVRIRPNDFVQVGLLLQIQQRFVVLDNDLHRLVPARRKLVRHHVDAEAAADRHVPAAASHGPGAAH